jgi:hypothetical protein
MAASPRALIPLTSGRPEHCWKRWRKRRVPTTPCPGACRLPSSPHCRKGTTEQRECVGLDKAASVHHRMAHQVARATPYCRCSTTAMRPRAGPPAQAHRAVQQLSRAAMAEPVSSATNAVPHGVGAFHAASLPERTVPGACARSAGFSHDEDTRRLCLHIRT